MGHVERFNPALLAAREHLIEPKFIECRRVAPFSFRSADIGVVLDLMIHDLDICLALAQSEVTRVDACGTPVLGTHEDMGLESHAVAAVIFVVDKPRLPVVPDNLLRALSMEDVRETLNMKVQATLPDDWATMSSAINLGEPLAVHAPKSRIRTTIRELAERLHQPERQSDEQDTGKRGRIFSKILSDA